MTVKKFLIPLRTNSKAIDPTDVGKIFLNIELIEIVASELAHELEKRIFVSSPENTQIGEVFYKKADELLQTYSLYCMGHTESVQVLSRLGKKKDFINTLKGIENDSELRSLSLVDWLIKPVQRICKYPLLLSELKKCTPTDHPDYQSVCNAYNSISSLVEQINANSKEANNIQSILSIENKVHNLPESLKLLMHGRYFIDEGKWMLQANNAWKERYLFLFNDILMITQPNLVKSNTYSHKITLPLQSIFVKEGDTPNKIIVGKNDGSREYILVAKDEKRNHEIVRKEWLQAILKSMNDVDSHSTEKGTAFKLEGNHVSRKELLAVVEVEQKISGWKCDYNPARNFIDSSAFYLHEWDPNSTDSPNSLEKNMWCFLLSDVLILAKKTKPMSSSKPFSFYECLNLSTLLASDIEIEKADQYLIKDETTFPFSLIIVNTQKKYILHATTMEQKEKWLNEIYSCLSRFLGGTLKTEALSNPRLNIKRHESVSVHSTLRTKKNFFGKKLGYEKADNNKLTESKTISEPIATPLKVSNQGVRVLPVMNPTELSQHNDPEKGEFETPPWDPDDSASNCLACDSKFTSMNRRHHCRNCGHLFCNKCTLKRCFLPRYGLTKKKVCAIWILLF